MEKETIEKLTSLVQLDIDAIDAYEQALKNIEHRETHKNLASFRDDHKEHIKDLGQIIKKLGGTVPQKKLDFKGFFISSFTAIRSMTGTTGALKAMEGNEELTTRTYEDALSWDMPKYVKSIINKNFNDEKRHLKYIQTALKEKPWEEKAA